MAEYNKVYASLKPELPKVIQREQIYVYAPKSSRSGMKSISSFNITAPVASVQYDTTDGITVTGNSSLVSEEVSGEKVTQNFQSEFRVPIRPGKYINIDATADNDAVEVKVDDTQLALDYYKINKTSTQSVPAYSPTKGRIDIQCAFSNIGSTLVQRGLNGEAVFNWILFDSWKKVGSSDSLEFNQLFRQCGDGEGYVYIGKTSTDTGTMSTNDIYSLRHMPKMNIVYDHQEYYRMDPVNAPDGTLNFIHIDSVQNGNSGYKATGKCLSITVSTREWKVFDLEFGGSGSGNGVETFTNISLTRDIYSGDVYGSDNGQTYNGRSTIQYKDSTTGKTKSQDIYTTVFLPIVGSDYINIAGDPANSRFVVRLDDTALAQDYVKIDKTAQAVVPQYADGKIKWTKVTGAPNGATIVARDDYGATYLNKLLVNRISTTNNEYVVPTQAITYGGYSDGFTVEKTPTDTGTLTTGVLDDIKSYPNAGLKYDNQSYIRMDPTNAPDGTLNFIHIDSIQDGSGGYKTTGKCFSITVSTRAWQVVDLDFGGSTRTTHNLTLNNSATGTSIYFSLTNNRPETYEGAPAGLWSALENSPIACTVDNNGIYAAGIITIDGDNFKAFYGNSEELLMTQTQVGITDSIVV